MQVKKEGEREKEKRQTNKQSTLWFFTPMTHEVKNKGKEAVSTVGTNIGTIPVWYGHSQLHNWSEKLSAAPTYIFNSRAIFLFLWRIQ